MEHRQRSGEVSRVSWRKGKGVGAMRDQGPPREANISVRRTEEGDTCPRALAGHDKNVEFISEGHRELLKAFRQKSVRIKWAFLKARSCCAVGSRTRRERDS